MRPRTRTSTAPAPAEPISASDPRWYKDAVIYQVHVRAFSDSNNDGIGDFPGLTQKLDYIQELGVTAIWLQPFYPSPLRDDGYDIAHYQGVNPAYGTKRDFLTFLDAAHDRGLRVITELVINHTSDQHPWFQAARRAKPGTSKRNFYVWSDDPNKYAGVPIVFNDTERSNWTWDPVAGAYFWHRFFHHQPDLNFDNPQVRKAVQKVMRFWLDMGVDGMRLDAVPYLVEREGTQCANLPETHEVLRELRREMDARYPDRMLLAEANQWPADVRAYFGDGDECHMAFHFPLMPRLYMALRQEDRHPLSEILYQTPEIPESCQWAIFLRNHDELTLEMVTDEERDYMYQTYAADPEMRINAGIRRRLAPLMENSRPRIELLTGLLLSLPGTPVLYYGDELGMGDNVYLGDRHAVRTPMQWNADRNGGFSRADTARLYAPPVVDPVYGFQAVNVEAQERSPHSLLNWMRRMLRLRQQHVTFGRGTTELLRPLNRTIFAFIRRYGAEDPILVVANLSRTVQPVSLDLSRVAGLIPVEMTGGVALPRITDAPYFLTLGPYAFLWLVLRREAPPTTPTRLATPPPEAEADEGPMLVGPEWWRMLEGSVRHLLEQRHLPPFLRRQLWCDTSSPIDRVTIVDWGVLAAEPTVLFTILDVHASDGQTARYALPLSVTGGDRADEVRNHTPEAVVAQVAGARKGVLHARLDGVTAQQLLALVLDNRTVALHRGRLQPAMTDDLAALDLPARIADVVPEPFDNEAFHSSASVGEKAMITVVRRVWPGDSPEEALTSTVLASGRFRRVPPIGARIDYVEADGARSPVSLVHQFRPHQANGWQHARSEIERFFELVVGLDQPPLVPSSLADLWSLAVPDTAVSTMGSYLQSMSVLGRRVAELHIALGADEVADRLGRAPLDEGAITRIADNVLSAWQRTSALLAPERRSGDAASATVDALAESDARVRAVVQASAADITPDGVLRPIHGHLDLAHVLLHEEDFTIIGMADDVFESPDQRLRLQPALTDVASLLHSIRMAADTSLSTYPGATAQHADRLAAWARAWVAWAGSTLLSSYEGAMSDAGQGPSDRESAEALLRLLLLERLFEDMRINATARPAWLPISVSIAWGLIEGTPLDDARA